LRASIPVFFEHILRVDEVVSIVEDEFTVATNDLLRHAGKMKSGLVN